MVGAKRGQLILQFLGESVLTAFLALGVGVIIAHITFPEIAELANWGDMSMTYTPDTVVATIPPFAGCWTCCRSPSTHRLI